MIFKIDKSCLVALNNKDKEAELALEILAINRKKCKNVIFADKSVLEDLMKRECFSPVVRSIYTSLFNKSMENKLYYSKVNKYINVVYTLGKNRISIVLDKESCDVTLEEISRFDISDCTELITENHEDSKMYKTLGKYYARTVGMEKFYIDFEFKMGGGDTTANTFDLSLKKHNRLCMCIVDSDRKFPDDGPGHTMQRVSDIIEGKDQDIWKALLLNVHEVENLIPLKWIENTTKDISNTKKTVDFLKFLISKSNEGDKSIYYFDFKNGIKTEKFVCVDESNHEIKKKFRKNERYRDYWCNYIKEYGINIKDAEGNHIIHGICKNILSRVLLEYEKDFDINEIDEHLKDEWVMIGRDVFSWCCVGNRIAV